MPYVLTILWCPIIFDLVFKPHLYIFFLFLFLQALDVNAILSPDSQFLPCFLSVSFFPEGQGFVSEDEYLEISDIKRDQSGEYECSALNDVAAPDVRKVKITVNCELIHCQGVLGQKRV